MLMMKPPPRARIGSAGEREPKRPRAAAAFPFKSAIAVGVVLILEAAGEPETMALRRFADELGILFQIVDDILDVTGSDEQLGKPSGSDERHGKLTYVSLFGLQRARELAAESHARASQALAEAPGDTGDLRGIADYVFTRNE